MNDQFIYGLTAGIAIGAMVVFISVCLSIRMMAARNAKQNNQALLRLRQVTAEECELKGGGK